MLDIIIGFISLIIGGGFIWWFISQTITKPGEILTSRYPSYYGSTEIAFIEAIKNNMLLFLLIGALIWLIVSAQRTSPAGHYG